MLQVQSFTFGPFQENTYLVSDREGNAIIFDPGCVEEEERQMLNSHIMTNNLKPLLLLNTHCHIDHITGNRFVFDQWKLKPLIHTEELKILEAQELTARMYQIPLDPSPMPERFIVEGEIIQVGDISLEVLFTPGHAPGHVVFYCKEESFVIGGDVLFRGSVGRTDLPYGNFEQLKKSILEKLYRLPDHTAVYSGHGEPTEIGVEKKSNPYVSMQGSD